MPLSQIQQEHVAKVFPENREQMGQYLEAGVEVVVYLQDECGDDVPPYAVAPTSNKEFWIGCWDTAEEAAQQASDLGLKVVQNPTPAHEQPTTVAHMLIRPGGELAMEVVRHKPRQASEAMMTVAQHDRIVSALKAEIDELKRRKTQQP